MFVRQQSTFYLHFLFFCTFAMGTSSLLAQTVLDGTNFQVNGTVTSNSQQNSSCATGGNGNRIFAWESFNDSCYAIHARLYDSEGAAIATEFVVDANPDVDQRMPSVAMDNTGDFVVTWMQKAKGTGDWDIYARRFNSAGTAAAVSSRVNETTANDQKYPAVAQENNGDYAVVWVDISSDLSTYSIEHRRFRAGGGSLSSDVQVDTSTVGRDNHPDIAMTSSGRYTITWQNNGIDGSGQGIMAQRYNHNGVAQGTNFTVNTTTTNEQIAPRVDMLDSEFHIITWSSQDQDGDQMGIYGQFIDSNGDPYGNEFRVNDTTTHVQHYADVAISDGGSAFFIWDDYALDGSFSGIYGKVIDTSGLVITGQFPLNTTTNLFQQFGAISVDGPGNFAISWQDGDRSTNASIDGSDYGVVAQFVVVDFEPPNLTCPGGQSDFYDASCEFTILDYSSLIAVSDDVDPSPTLTQFPTIGSKVDRDTMIRFIAEDAVGNRDTCYFALTLSDTIAPVATCPGSLADYYDVNCQFTLPDYTGSVTVLDNCDPNPTIVQTPSAGMVVDSDTIIKFVATDINGNKDSCTVSLTLSDSIRPTITCPGDQMQNLDANCQVALADYTGLASAMDNCGTAVVSQSPSPGTVVNGTTSPVAVTLTVTDGNANTANCSFNVILLDVTKPILSCPGGQFATLDANCQFSIVDYTSLVAISDNCDLSPDVVQKPGVGSIVEVDTVVTIVVSDASGNQDSCSFTLSLVDNTLPTITCPPAQSDSYGPTCEFTLLDYRSLVTTADNCDDNPAVVQKPAAGQVVDRDTVITMIVTDASGNQDSCSFMLTLADTTKPTITCPTTQNDSYDQNCQFTLPDYRNLATAMDNCDGSPLVVQKPAAGALVNTDTMITLVVTDAAGNSDSCIFMLELADTTKPTVVCPDPLADYYDSNCQFSLLDYRSLLTVNDNCDANAVVQQIPPLGTLIDGDTMIKFIVTDASGNIDSCMTTLTLADSIKPTIACPGDQIAILDASCQVSLADYTGLASANDNCGSVNITQSPIPGTIVSGVGTVVLVTLTATDGSSNTQICTFQVTTQDNMAPSISCSGNQNDSYDANCEFTIVDYSSLITVLDNCDASPSVIQKPAIGSKVDRDTIITLVAMDASGNMDSCSFSLMLSDTMRPSIVCPAAQNDSYGPNCDFTLLDYRSLATAMDNCDQNPTIIQKPAAGQVVDKDTTIILVVTDFSGNQDSCSFTLTLADTTKPTITCPLTQNDSYDQNCEFTLLDYRSLATAMDNCDGNPSIVQKPSVGALVSSDTMITLVVTDASGNADSCTFSLVLADTTKPMVTCPDPLNDYYDGNCQFSLLDYRSLLTVNDNCDANTVVQQIPSVGTLIDSDTIIKFIVTDASGNMDSCMTTLTLADSIKPTITCPGNQIAILDESCEVMLDDYTGLATALDNCSSVNVTQIPAPGSLYTGTGTVIPVTLTATDASGNTQICSFQVTTQDNLAPSISCSGNQMDYFDANCEFTIVDYSGLAMVADNCDASPAMIQKPAVGSKVDKDTTITLISVDASGNMDSCSFSLMLSDTMKPTIVCPIAQNDSYGPNCDFTLLDYRTLASVMDNCDGNPSVVQKPAAGQLVDSDTIVTLVVTDASGNQDSCSFVLILSDTTKPTIACIPDQYIQDLDCSYQLPDYRNMITYADNCDSNPVLTQNPPGGAIINGNTTITMTVQDASGNSNFCSFDVILFDTTTFSIMGPAIICPLMGDATYEVVNPNPAATYTWTCSDPSATITGNGNSEVMIGFDENFNGGVLSVVATTGCGATAPQSLDIQMGSSQLCDAFGCFSESQLLIVNDDVLNAPNSIDVYQALSRLDSDGTIEAVRSILFRAGTEINLNPGFNVELGAVFTAEIQSCLLSILDE